MTIDTKALREPAQVVYREVGLGSHAWCVEQAGERIATFPLGANAKRNAERVAAALNIAHRLMDDASGAAVALGLDYTAVPMGTHNPLTAKAREVADRLAALEEQLRLANIDALSTEAERAALEAELARVRERAAQIADDFHPSCHSEVDMALSEMREAVAALSQPAEQKLTLSNEALESFEAILQNPPAPTDKFRRAVRRLGELGQEADLPLMSRVTFVRCRRLISYICNSSNLPPDECEIGGIRYRIADTDEHGLQVIPRTADMPEGAKYAYASETGGGWSAAYEPSIDSVWQRIEDYQHGQEGRE